MANELAAIVGELERLDATISALSSRRERLAAERDAFSHVGAVMGLEQLQHLVLPVRAHRAYGGRGFLVDWLRGMLQAAAPHWVDTRTLVSLAERDFSLTFPSPVERDAYRKNTLGRALRKLLSQDLVERQHDPERASTPSLWRWKVAAGAADLLAHKEAA